MLDFEETDKPTEAKKPKDIGEKIKCITSAIGKAVKKTEFEGVFEELKKDMETVGDRVKACKNETSKMEVAK